MKRVLYISHSIIPSPAANSVHVMQMADALSSECSLVRLLLFRSWRRWRRTSTLRENYGVSAQFRLTALPNVPSRISKKFLALMGLAIAKIDGIDYVYTRMPTAALLSARNGRRTCLELHHTLDHSEEDWLALQAYLSIGTDALLVTITEALKEKIATDFNVSRERILVAHDGANKFDFTVRAALPPVSEGRLRVGFLGHLYKGKGMEMIEKLVPLAPWADFAIVGGTYNDIRYWKQRLRQFSNVSFVGFVPHSHTAGYLRSFDIAVLPNQNHVGVAGRADVNISQWTSPLKAFEYMSAGLPIIASDQANLREIFRHGETALLCAAENETDWLRALTLLKNDYPLRCKLGHNARSDFESRFTWRVRAQRVLTFLDQASASAVTKRFN